MFHLFITFFVTQLFKNAGYILKLLNVISLNYEFSLFVCCDLKAFGNCHVGFKFKFINNLVLRFHAIYPLFIIGLCEFYRFYCPWFKTNIKQLWKLQLSIHQKSIPSISWTSQLITLFDTCKTNLVTFLFLLVWDIFNETW